MRPMQTLSSALLAGALLSGCTAGVARQTAGDLSVSVTELNQGLSAWQAALREDADGRVSRIAGQRARLADHEHELERLRAVWQLAGRKQAAKLHQGIQEIVAKDLAIELELENRLDSERATLVATQKKYASLQRTLASLARQLQAMAKEPGPEAEVRFLISFGQATNKALSDLENEVEKDVP